MVLNKGQLAPDFKFINQDGKETSLHAIEGKKIVFFFPRAFTAACTKEACSLQDSYSDLKQEGVTEVIGISMDSADKQQDFKDKYNLEYVLVDDKDGRISKAYDVFSRKLLLFKFSSRYTFVINEQNQIDEVFENGLRGNKSKLGMENHGQEILEYIQ